jgi:hypothetical protein
MKETSRISLKVEGCKKVDKAESKLKHRGTFRTLSVIK